MTVLDAFTVLLPVKTCILHPVRYVTVIIKDYCNTAVCASMLCAVYIRCQVFAGPNSSEDEGKEAQHTDHDEDALASTSRMTAVTLCGLFKRVGKYAADRRESVNVLRIGALQWLAAVSRRLGGEKLAAHDNVLLVAVARPLYQIQEGTGLDGEQVPYHPLCLSRYSCLLN